MSTIRTKLCFCFLLNPIELNPKSHDPLKSTSAFLPVVATSWSFFKPYKSRPKSAFVERSYGWCRWRIRTFCEIGARFLATFLLNVMWLDSRRGLEQESLLFIIMTPGVVNQVARHKSQQQSSRLNQQTLIPCHGVMTGDRLKMWG